MTRVAVGLIAFASGLLAGWALFARPGDAPRRAGRERRGARATRRPAEAMVPAPEAGARTETPAADVGPAADGKLVVTDPVAVERALRRRIVEIYRERNGEEIPQDMLDAAIGEAVRGVQRAPENYAAHRARWIRSRELTRRAVGEISSPGDLLLQGRTPGRINVSLLSGARGVQATSKLSSQPLDIETRVVAEEASAAFVRGGILPPGKALVVERVDISAVLGLAGRRRRAGELEVRLPGDRDLRWERLHQAFRLTLTGRRAVYAGQEASLHLRLQNGAAQVRVRGTLLDVAEARKVAPARFVLEGYDGFLTGEPVLLQVLADHGGGNPR
ncbi:MAG: hypothetical protein ACE5JG_09310, partial [Planctomycetota bacterium]